MTNIYTWISLFFNFQFTPTNETFSITETTKCNFEIIPAFEHYLWLTLSKVSALLTTVWFPQSGEMKLLLKIHQADSTCIKKSHPSARNKILKFFFEETWLFDVLKFCFLFFFPCWKCFWCVAVHPLNHFTRIEGMIVNFMAKINVSGHQKFH